MGIAVLKIDPALMRDVLHLPSNCEIIGDPYLNLLVDHPDIPDDAIEVSAIFVVTGKQGRRSTQFKEWLVAQVRQPKCAHCGGSGRVHP
jgi:hypothetical protein